ncbi:BrnT family toxin [Roseicella aquatilis]|nr:BrnT family toxin [Roseicella aquatilis]
MLFEWDEKKRHKNVEKHGFDFILSYELFYNDYVRKRAHDGEDGEERWMATGFIRGRYATAIYTMRGETIRMISLRSARDEEKQRHQNAFG